MGPNSFRNLTYAAVLLVVGSLVYLIYQSSKKKREKVNPDIESTAGLGNFNDTLNSIAGASTTTLSSSAAALGDSVNSAVDGQLLSAPAAARPSSAKGYSSGVSDVKDVTVTDPGSIVGKTTTTAKPKSPAAKPAAKPAKFDSGTGEKGDFMVVAGAFASKDNAEGLVAKLKKMGFAKAEAVKLENSSSTHVVAGFYAFKGGAEAAVRTLKKNKVEAFVKKRSGDIYKSATPAAKPAAKPTASKPS